MENGKNCSGPEINIPVQHLSPSPLEQVFSNALILNTIWKNFSTQNLLAISCVSVGWCARSREFLTINSKTNKSEDYTRVQIRGANPCRALARFNTFLEEMDRENRAGISFNGIQHYRYYPTYSHEKQTPCTNCLFSEWRSKANNQAIRRSMLEELLKQSYGRILEKFKFNSICFDYNINRSCPFGWFINFLLSHRVADVRELQFTGGSSHQEELECTTYFLSTLSPNGLHAPKVFPNLEVLRVRTILENLPVEAPALKRLKDFTYNMSPRSHGHDLAPDFPYHVLTHVDQLQPTVDGVRFANVVELCRPNIEFLRFDWVSPNHQDEHQLIGQSLEYRSNLFKLGQFCSSTLTFFMCSISALTFITTKWDAGENDISEPVQNNFPRLKKLKLYGWPGVDTVDWLGSLDFSKSFPKVTTVTMKFIKPEKMNSFIGPYNQTHGCVFQGLSKLSLEQDESKVQFFPSLMPRVIRLFSNIRHLNLAGMHLKYDCHDQTFGEVISELESLPMLEELTLWPTSIPNSLGFDHIFLEREILSEMTSTLAKVKMESMMIYKYSVLYHKSLKRINIDCLWNVCVHKEPRDDQPCYSEQLPGKFPVSSQTAQAICKYRPGFKINVATHCLGCTSYVGPAGLRMEHLKPYTRSALTRNDNLDYDDSDEDYVDDDKDASYWLFEFLEMKHVKAHQKVEIYT